jgi:hypothetical protein
MSWLGPLSANSGYCGPNVFQNLVNFWQVLLRFATVRCQLCNRIQHCVCLFDMTIVRQNINHNTFWDAICTGCDSLLYTVMRPLHHTATCSWRFCAFLQNVTLSLLNSESPTSMTTWSVAVMQSCLVCTSRYTPQQAIFTTIALFVRD